MFFLPKLEQIQRTIKTETAFSGLDNRPERLTTRFPTAAGISGVRFSRSNSL